MREKFVLRAAENETGSDNPAAVDVRNLVAAHPQFKGWNLNAQELGMLQQSANALLAAPKGQNKRAFLNEMEKYPDDERGRQLLTILSTRILTAVLAAKGEVRE